jgi:hypothetical protein
MSESSQHTARRPYVADNACIPLLLPLLLLLLLLLSSQVDAHLSYDAKACYDKAMHLMDMYAARGEWPVNHLRIVRVWVRSTVGAYENFVLSGFTLTPARLLQHHKHCGTLQHSLRMCLLSKPIRSLPYLLL